MAMDIAPDTPRELLPGNIANRPSGAFLCFLFFVLHADPRPA